MAKPLPPTDDAEERREAPEGRTPEGRASEPTELERAAARMVPVDSFLRERFKGADGKPLAEEVTAGELDAALQPTRSMLVLPGVSSQIVPVADDYLAAMMEISDLKCMSPEAREGMKDYDKKLKEAEKEAKARLKNLEERIGARVDKMKEADLGGKDPEEVKKDMLALFQSEVDNQIAEKEGLEAKERMEKSGKKPKGREEGREEEGYAPEEVAAGPVGPPPLPSGAKGTPMGKKSAVRR